MAATGRSSRCRGSGSGSRCTPRLPPSPPGSFHAKAPPAIRGGGYVVEALEAALWALQSSEGFEDGVLAAVNLGDDADTTAAIYGQLAGAAYGSDAIPERWRGRVVMGARIVELADELFELAGSI